ncbi:cytochrome P450 [Scleroderma yunnanense]
MEDFSPNPLLWACSIVLAVGILGYVYIIPHSHKLDHIPTVGSSSLLGSYWSALKFVNNGFQTVQQGFDQYQTGVFKISTLIGWTVILNPSHIDEVAKLPIDVMSFQDAMIQVEYTLGPEFYHNPYHVTMIRIQFNRNLSALLSDMRDEMIVTLGEILDLKPNEWKSVPVAETTQILISRMFNRIMVGLPLCRDPDWLDLTMKVTIAVIIEGLLIGLFPDFMAPLAAKFITKTSLRVRRGAKHLDDIIRDRQRYMQECGEEWADKPNDILQWCLDHGEETTVPLLSTRLLGFAFVSMLAFAKVLCVLAKNPQYVQPLREEVKMAINEHGWTKGGIAEMRKVDSFIKETLRFQGGSAYRVERKTRTDVTLSDGTFLPKGTHVAFASHAIEHDGRNYENPDIFKPFRFVDLQDKCGDPSRYQLASLSHDSLLFGLGKSACPGRFLAAMIQKALLAHVLVTYDLKPEHLPESRPINGVVRTSRSSKILFRKRLD